MEELEKLAEWLMPWFEGEDNLTIDEIGPGMGSGLFPMGTTVLHRQEDVVGNRYVRNRLICQLRRIATAPDGTIWLAALAHWVQSQSEQGSTPGMGDIPKTETVSAQNGRLLKQDDGGTATYVIDLVCEYTRVYKTEE